ncbi:ABC transporter ATP-binding protein [Bacillus sp. PS06]|uniref:ABC transporter ATP-binding protein n=1 Tax=Bacillus sp. PS06 TaxID=2764176 RepID=UPI0017821949|nr:ABC transporter ATP-binding protein [Bacillus sp. PS06]MBD8069475.1 ABC transporter ATP-binding protein [Bacillus sp. PS06]
MAFITVEKLTKDFGKKTVVSELSFSIKKGSCTALLGPNGAGKTTTLKMLAGLLKPSKGQISLNEQTSGDLREDVGFLPQFPVFYSWMTAEEFLIYVGRLSHLSKKEAKERAKELIELVGLTDASDQRIGGFSGGMKQRLGIAQAMVHQPKLLILDEPVSALDPVGRRDVIDMLSELKKQTTILFSTHVLSDAEEVCDEIIIIRKGELALDSSIKDMRTKYQQDILKIRLKETSPEWMAELRAYDFIEEVKDEKGSITLYVSDVERAKVQVLRDFVEKNLPVTSFSVGQSSLEDVFIEVVKE